MSKPNFEIAVDTRLLHQALSKVRPGEEISYAKLSEVVGYKVDGANTNLQSAIRRCFSNDEIVFDNIRGTGYRRLTDEEIISAATRDTDALRRKSRKAAKKLAVVTTVNEMAPEKRIEHNARLSLFAAITAMTKPKAIEQLKSNVSSFGTELPFAKTLEAFRPKSVA